MTTTTTVVGKVKAPDGTVVEGAEILARLNGFDYDEEFGYITSRRISTTTDANGEFSFELWPNTRGTEGTIYRIVINSPVNGVSTNFTATIPEQDEVELNDAADFDPVPPLSDSEQLVNDAKAFKDKAKAFATEAEDVEVETGLFSALHYSAKAEDSATAASTSESNASTSESNAASSASAASTSASNAATSESNAASSASAAATSETNAQTAETGAVSAKDDAVAAKNATENIFDTFDDRFLGSFSSAPTTDNDGNPIVAGAVYYDTTQQEVYFYNGATWDAPAAQAETSATNALASENAAATSESNAATSESNAANSETAAANSASAAATSESNAATSETNAASSASAAATSESNAATSESNAAASASAAATSESNAASSATSAATSESNAATSETNAANSASAAATSETNAANSASAASTSETNAQAAATDAETALDNFTDQYLGPKSSDPATDNDGDPLVTGAIYYNTTEGQLYIWDGSAWQQAAFSAEGTVLSFNGRDGVVTLQSADVTNALGYTPYDASNPDGYISDYTVTSADVTTALGYTPQDESTAYGSADFSTDFGAETTDALTEGTSNLYYTDARADARVSSGISTHETAPDPHTQYAQSSSLATVATSGSYGDLANTANSIGADELKVATSGAAGQALLSDGDGTFSWGQAGKTDAEIRGLFSASGDLTYDSATGVFSVTTATVPDILKPDVISPIDGETEVVETPTIKTGGYYSLFGIEQASAQFQIATDSAFSNIVYDSGVLGAVTEHQVPAGNLAETTTHYVRVEFKDTSNNTSGFSDTSEFDTGIFLDVSDPNNIGVAVGGGFLAGNVVSDVDSQTYAIIVSDGDGDTDRTGAGKKAWRTSNTALTEAQTLADGKSVMDHIVNNETLSDFPAFEWIQTTLNNANYNGYSDWYLPARDELELIYRHFKASTLDNNDGTRPSGTEFGADGATYGTNNSSDPNGSGYTLSDPSQTSITSFQNGGADYLSDGNYLSSTEYDASDNWIHGFGFGRGSQRNLNKDFPRRVRAVRRIAL